jgi:uncharacterized protein with gpF-like domain
LDNNQIFRSNKSLTNLNYNNSDKYLHKTETNNKIKINTEANNKIPEKIINRLKENIAASQKELRSLHHNHIENMSQRNEAQQLLQRCIQDVKFDINKIIKDISILQKKTNLLMSNDRFEIELKMKKTHLSNLENKLKILTFVYDNSFQTINYNPNKITSPIFKNNIK